MVCNRCKLIVQQVLEKSGVLPLSVTLGEVIVEEELSNSEKLILDSQLQKFGFLLIEDKSIRMVSQIKCLIIELVHYRNNSLNGKLSEYLSHTLHHDYTHLSNLFSDIEHITIERYYITQKIEKVKELLVYDELSLSEIAYRLNYSSVAHLSNQFKKITGYTPTHFKNTRTKDRRTLDEI